MTAFNTGNPIGSTNPKDLYDNAQNLDVLVNSNTDVSHADRLGVQRKTWHGIEAAFDADQAQRSSEFAQFLADSAYQDLGVYGAGIEVTRYNQVFLKDGEFYRAAAMLVLPYTTTGAWVSESASFVGVGDAVLRQDLGSTDSGQGSALVGIQDSGDYFTGGTVEAALQEVGAEMATPRVIAKGGTGASTTQGALANLGVVSVNYEVTINASLTIPNVFPASYVVKDSASPADYNIFLPAAAAVGSVVFFRIDQAATKLFTLYDGGTLMDGIDRRILWAGESAMLYKTSTGWTKIGGQSIPMHGALRRSASQSLTTGGWQSVVFTEGVHDNKALNLCFDAANGRFIARRAGVYKFTASLPVAGITVGSETYGAFALSLGSSASGNPTATSTQTREAGQSRNTHNISNMYKLGRNEKYGCAVYAISGTPQLEYQPGVLEISMTYEEVVTW